MTPSPDRPATESVEQRLSQLLIRLDQRIDDYLDYLQQLHIAIRDSDAARLEQLLPHHRALQQAVDARLAERDQLLSELGVDSLGAALEKLGQPATLQRKRESLEDKLEQLRQQLMSNDLLLRKSQERLRQSIGILAGHFESPRASAYSRKGALDPDSPRRSLARA